MRRCLCRTKAEDVTPEWLAKLRDEKREYHVEPNGDVLAWFNEDELKRYEAPS